MTSEPFRYDREPMIDVSELNVHAGFIPSAAKFNSAGAINTLLKNESENLRLSSDDHSQHKSNHNKYSKYSSNTFVEPYNQSSDSNAADRSTTENGFSTAFCQNTSPSPDTSSSKPQSLSTSNKNVGNHHLDGFCDGETTSETHVASHVTNSTSNLENQPESALTDSSSEKASKANDQQDVSSINTSLKDAECASTEVNDAKSSNSETSSNSPPDPLMLQNQSNHTNNETHQISEMNYTLSVGTTSESRQETSEESSCLSPPSLLPPSHQSYMDCPSNSKRPFLGPGAPLTNPSTSPYVMKQAGAQHQRFKLNTSVPIGNQIASKLGHIPVHQSMNHQGLASDLRQHHPLSGSQHIAQRRYSNPVIGNKMSSMFYSAPSGSLIERQYDQQDSFLHNPTIHSSLFTEDDEMNDSTSSMDGFEVSPMQQYLRNEESKQKELNSVPIDRSRIRSLSAGDALTHPAPNTNYLDPCYLEHRETKKLCSLTYAALFRALANETSDVREKYFISEHPQVDHLKELAGMIYFLNVPKGSRKPPHVGHAFRSYSDSHYTSVDREIPIICKVKEFTLANDTKNVWRLYHYYQGNKKRAPRKRGRGEMMEYDSE